MNECRERKSLGVGAKVLRTFILGSENSWERKFQGAKVLGTFQRPKVPGFLELSLPGAKVLRSVRVRVTLSVSVRVTVSINHLC